MYGSPPPWNVCSPYLYVPNTHTHHWRMLHTDIMTFVKKKKGEALFHLLLGKTNTPAIHLVVCISKKGSTGGWYRGRVEG
mmetsp:Transcript_25601/g.33414  ORF Transcript_25601/g.33414 Transcript_25601/m.33414 type:complete len:80 (+) Transcript_25601:1259-1498(+)